MLWTASTPLVSPRPGRSIARTAASRGQPGGSHDGWFKPFTYRDLRVRPADDDRALPDDDRASIAVDILLKASSAFGTGEHATTQLCLEFLRERQLEGESVLDYGCGTGVLSIAAAKLGASMVAGVDVDPEAINAAEENMRLNTLSFDRIILCGSGEVSALISPASLDICVVNMLFPEQVGGHISLDIASFIRQGGSLCVSGIRDEPGEIEGVKSEYGKFFTFVEDTKSRDGWVRMIAERNATKLGATSQSIQELSESAM